MSSSKLKVVAVSEKRTAKDGREFFILSFSPGFGQRIVKRTMWEQFVRDTNGNPTTEKYWERGSHAEALALMKSGELIEGKKATNLVPEYTIGTGENTRKVNTYSTVVFPDETAERVFAAANHPILDAETGELKGQVAILATAPAMEEVEADA